VKESGGVYVYSVTCLGVGESILTLTVGNKKSATLPRPVTRSSTIKVGRQSQGLTLTGNGSGIESHLTAPKIPCPKSQAVRTSVSDPDWIQIQSGQWVRNQNPNPGGQK
jgi:hypothetical protein